MIRLAGYLPSLLAIAALLVIGLGLDRLNLRLQDRETRLDVSGELALIQTRLESRIDTGTRIARGMSAILSGTDNVNQQQFSRLVSTDILGLPEILNVAWAPDLVITMVHPFSTNRELIGLDYRDLPDQIGHVESTRDSGSATISGPLELVQGGQGIIVRVPVFRATGGMPVFAGILSVVFDLDSLLEQGGIQSQSPTLDILLVKHEPGAQSGQPVSGDPTIRNDDPVSAEIHLPGERWTIYARPAEGWHRAKDNVLALRLTLAGLIGVLLAMTLTANWLAETRRRTIRQMEISDHRLEGMMRNAPGAFFDYVIADGVPDRIEYITDACEAIWELPPQAFYDDSRMVWPRTDTEEWEELRQEFARAGRENARWHFIWRHVTPSGKEKWLEGWGEPRPIRQGGVRWHNFVVDITEARAKDIELERQAVIAHQAQKQQSIGQLTGGVAHDFNNLLAVIMGNLELLRDEEEDLERLRMIDAGIDASRRGADLTRSMIAFARKARLQPQMIDLNVQVAETSNWAGRTLPESIRVETVLPKGLWQIEADPSSTEAALLNLILNARDAMPSGGRLGIETANLHLDETRHGKSTAGLPPGRYVSMAVSDTGHGIPSEQVSKIFEPFFTTKPPGAGSGLGLSMVQGFMEQSGGAVRVTSKPGIGTTFTLYFPVKDPETQPRQDPASHSVATPFAGKQILLVEDEDAVRFVLAKALRKVGYQVSEAGSGDEALEIFLARSDIDLLLTDIVMPGKLQGIALSHRLREVRPDLPVIFLSGYASDAVEPEHGSLPGDIRLMKPINRPDLLEALSRKLGK